MGSGPIQNNCPLSAACTATAARGQPVGQAGSAPAAGSCAGRTGSSAARFPSRRGGRAKRSAGCSMACCAAPSRRSRRVARWCCGRRPAVRVRRSARPAASSARRSGQAADHAEVRGDAKPARMGDALTVDEHQVRTLPQQGQRGQQHRQFPKAQRPARTASRSARGRFPPAAPARFRRRSAPSRSRLWRAGRHGCCGDAGEGMCR
ncbi:hypothetical protein PD5205_02746 [Xanthomonas fragariae]|uniref:Uncharacterized protein n=1 Tax=Xanthomonas fragariae TaxID=48664 RepID=A0A1Y6H8B3_9XANT|nr:hypothetical protein NBC2815_02746 [Xanthomonas fragariae]SMQ98500.1 hypothetical protein PD885_01249 [Xanthomonas fragariae]SMR04036.1 hypothetical protein PD5205_02746 [Xanthomonas fragariae]